jgi:hypothetical protein
MPVHSPGPRLFRSIPFKHIGGNLRGEQSRSADVHLDLAGFLGVFAVLVTFLIMVFSASGELITAQRGLTLPDATNESPLRRAPVIIVTRDAVTFDGEEVARTRALEEDAPTEVRILDLYDRLEEERARFRRDFSNLPAIEQERCAREGRPIDPNEMCLDGLLILQADRETSARVLNRIVMTAYAVEYDNILFAVNRREQR